MISVVFYRNFCHFINVLSLFAHSYRNSDNIVDISLGPDGREIHAGNRESNGKYTFAAHQDGVYKYCFSNKVNYI